MANLTDLSGCNVKSTNGKWNLTSLHDGVLLKCPALGSPYDLINIKVSNCCFQNTQVATKRCMVCSGVSFAVSSPVVAPAGAWNPKPQAPLCAATNDIRTVWRRVMQVNSHCMGQQPYCQSWSTIRKNSASNGIGQACSREASSCCVGNNSTAVPPSCV